MWIKFNENSFEKKINLDGIREIIFQCSNQILLAPFDSESGIYKIHESENENFEEIKEKLIKL